MKKKNKVHFRQARTQINLTGLGQDQSFAEVRIVRVGKKYILHNLDGSMFDETMFDSAGEALDWIIEFYQAHAEDL